jgi:hypothetical protein
MLGWAAGELEVVLVEGWVVITQPARLRLVQDRCGQRARFSVERSGVQRVGLRPAHLMQLGIGEDRQLLIASVPGHGALVIVSPQVCAVHAPAHVQLMLRTEQQEIG